LAEGRVRRIVNVDAPGGVVVGEAPALERGEDREHLALELRELAMFLALLQEVRDGGRHGDGREGTRRARPGGAECAHDGEKAQTRTAERGNSVLERDTSHVDLPAAR
jgi:hypothetical protein